MLARSQPRLTHDPFSLGVASGSPDDSSVVLWTRLLGLVAPGVTVRWELAHDAQFSRLVQSGHVQALAALAHSVHVEPQGLAPDRVYFYRFMAGDAVSPVGRTRTLPAPDAPVARLRLAYASCQRWDHGYFSAYRHMRADDPDLVVFLGDYIYEYPSAKDAVRPVTGAWVQTLDDYRQRYALHKSDPDLQAMHAACPWLMIWDDHEVHNDYAGLHPGQAGPPPSDFPARRAAAYQAFYEHSPVRQSALPGGIQGLLAGAGIQIYQHVPYGRLASFYLTDTRQYRDRQVCNAGDKPGSSTLDPATCPAWHDPARSLLGQGQEAWLDEAFARSGAQWNVLAQQTLLGPRDFQPGPGQRLWNDGWDGYASARQRLIDSLRKNRVANPVVLGGDVHENWVGHVKADYAAPASPNVGVEFCGTSISSRSFGNAHLADWLAENPHFVFGDSERKGYGLAELTPQRMDVRLRVVADVARADTGIATLAAFTVAAGKPQVERV